MEEIISLIFEMFALVFLAIFTGVLDSKYYQRFELKPLMYGIWVAVIGLAFLIYPDVPLDTKGLSLFWVHIPYNLGLIGLYVYACRQFGKLKFQYKKQYLAARWLLYMGIVFEVLVVSLQIYIICS